MRYPQAMLGASVVALCCSCSTAPVAKVEYKDISQEVIALNAAAGNTHIPPADVANNQLTPAAFAKMGYQLARDQCDTYFDAIAMTDNGIKMTKADVVAAGTAAAVILTLTKATAKEIGITAATFGLAGTVIDNYEQYAFATPYPIQTYILVKKALDAYEQASPPSSAKDLEDAAALIRGYARLCSYVGIASLSEQAIAKGAPADASQNAGPLFTDAEKTNYIHPINSDLGVADNTLTDNDYVVIGAIADPAITDTPTLTKLAGSLSSNVSMMTTTTKIFDGMSKQSAMASIWLLVKPLINENAQFAARVKDAQATAQGGGTVAPPTHRAQIFVY